MTNRALVLACCLSMLLGCNKAAKAEPAPYASDTLPTDAVERVNEICNRLTKVGVAKNCLKDYDRPHSVPFFSASFDAVPKGSCYARVYLTEDKYKANAPKPATLVATSTAAAMWKATVECDVKPTKAFSDAATRIVDGK